MIDTEEEARSYCAALVGQDGMDRLERFSVLLAEENQRQNLVSTASLGQIWRRHLADSLQLLAHVPRVTGPWVDLGTGAGPPGLIIAVALRERDVRLVESRRRRAEWLDHVVTELNLRCCVTIGDRLQDVPPFPAKVISARAFAPLKKLLKLSTPFSTPDTTWVLPKGRSAQKELQEQDPVVAAMFHVEPSITDAEAGILVGRGSPPIT